MKNDILNTHSSILKENPYSIPEGYFEVLQSDLMRKKKRSFASPYISIAAACILFVTAGLMLMKKTAMSDEMSFEDYLVHSDYVLTEGYEDEIKVIEHDIDADDIIEYLIYTGVTAEVIEHSK